MTDKQIIIDYENLCKNYSKEVGCYNTFDGSCNKEQCFTYKLLQLLQAKEQECEELKERLESFQKDYSKLYQVVENKGYIKELDQLKAENEKLKQTLIDIKEIAEECYYECNSMNNCNISCKYYNDCNGEFSYLLAYLNKQISEVENEHNG